jgi:hypothetical protein
MNDDPKDPSDPPAPPPPPVDRQWFLDAHTAYEDLSAVMKDAIRRKRKRRLGPSEQRRLYREAREKLDALFARAL